MFVFFYSEKYGIIWDFRKFSFSYNVTILCYLLLFMLSNVFSFLKKVRFKLFRYDRKKFFEVYGKVCLSLCFLGYRILFGGWRKNFVK